MHQTFDTGFDFNEGTVIGDVGDLTEQARALRITTSNADPRIFAQLLQAQRHTVLFLIELENLGFEFLTDLNHFARMTNTTPGEVGDVEQTVDTAQINEGTVIGDVLDDTLDDGAFLERVKELGAFFAHAGFDHGTAGNHDVVALTVELDDLEFHGLAFVGRGVLNRTGVNQGARQEGTDTVGHNRETALDLARDRTGNEFAGFEGLFKVHPSGKTLGLVARQNRITVAVFDLFNRHSHEITRLHGDFTAIVLEFFDRHIGFGLQAGVHDHKVVVHAHHFSRDDFALAHFLTS